MLLWQSMPPAPGSQKPRWQVAGHCKQQESSDGVPRATLGARAGRAFSAVAVPLGLALTAGCGVALFWWAWRFHEAEALQGKNFCLNLGLWMAVTALGALLERLFPALGIRIGAAAEGDFDAADDDCDAGDD